MSKLQSGDSSPIDFEIAELDDLISSDAEKNQIQDPAESQDDINPEAVQLALEQSEVEAEVLDEKKSEALSYVEPQTPTDENSNEKVESQKDEKAHNSSNEVEEEKQIEEENEKVVKNSNQSQSQEEDEDCELLDVLCDNLEAEEHEQKRQEHKKAMTKIIDDKLKKIQESKTVKKMAEMEKSASQAKEQRSGLLIRTDTRVIEDDEIQAKVGSRKFIPIEKLDSLDARNIDMKMMQSLGIFTIGVLVDKSPLKTSGNGKKFMMLKLSDLVKYDINQVKKHLTAILEPQIAAKKCNENEINISMKSFSRNGYKQISFTCFGECAESMFDYRHGVIVAILNPKLWKANAEYGVSYSIDNSAQMFIIGYSQDYDVCRGKTVATTLSNNKFNNEPLNCRIFVNRSVETLCDQHKFEQRMNSFNKFRSGRANTMGDKVDINAINKIRKMQELEHKEMSFLRSDKSVLNRAGNRPMPMLSPKSRAKKEEDDKKLKGSFSNYMEYRQNKFTKPINHGPLQSGFKSLETEFAKKSSYTEKRKEDLKRNIVQAPTHQEADPEDDELEIDYGEGQKQNLNINLFKRMEQKKDQKENVCDNKKSSYMEYVARQGVNEKQQIKTNEASNSTFIRDRFGLKKKKI